EPLDDDKLSHIRGLFVAALDGKRLEDASVAVSELANNAPQNVQGPILAIATVLIETLVERNEDRLVLGGTSNLARSAGDFAQETGGMDNVLEALEEQVVVLRLLAHAQHSDSVTVQIG